MRLSMLLIAILALICPAIAIFNEEDQFGRVENGFDDGRDGASYNAAQMENYENQRYARKNNQITKEFRDDFQKGKYKSKHKSAKHKYEPKDSKLKFRHYKQKKERSLSKPKTLELNNPKGALDDFELNKNNQFDQGQNRSVGEFAQILHNMPSKEDWDDESSNKVIDLDESDGFSFRNLMPFWRPFDTLRKENQHLFKNAQAPCAKALQNLDQQHNEPNNLGVLKDNFLLLPDQTKFILIKALEHEKKDGPERFDNLVREDGLKIIKVGGKSDLKLEIMDEEERNKILNKFGEGNDKSATKLNAGDSCSVVVLDKTEHDNEKQLKGEQVRKEERTQDDRKNGKEGKDQDRYGTNKDAKQPKEGEENKKLQKYGGNTGSQGKDIFTYKSGATKEGDENASTETFSTTECSSTTERDLNEKNKGVNSSTKSPTKGNFSVRPHFGNKQNFSTSFSDELGIVGDKTCNSSVSKTNNLEKDLKEEILNCTAEKLEKYLKSLKDQFGQPTANLESKLPERRLHTVKDSFVPETVKLISSQQDLLMNNMLQHLSKADLLRLNITINGLVVKDDKPSQIHGNATIHLSPTNHGEDRRRRGIKIPFLKKKNKKKNNEDQDIDKEDEFKDIKDNEKDEKCDKKTKSKPKTDPLETEFSKDAMSSYQISNEIVKMVSQMVHSNPNMKTLWPSLKRNRPGDPKKSAATIRKLCKGPGRRRLEEMIRRAMSSVDEIIEQEVQQRSCAPLSEDLHNFYEMILSLHAKHAKRTEEREERLSKTENLGEECSTKKSDACDKGDDVDLNENSLFDLIHERRLKYDQEMSEIRRSREAVQRNHDLETETANSTLVRRLREGYSPAFLKLHEVADTIDRAAVGSDAL